VTDFVSGLREATREVSRFVIGPEEVTREVSCFVSGPAEVIREVSCFVNQENRVVVEVACLVRCLRGANVCPAEVIREVACFVSGPGEATREWTWAARRRDQADVEGSGLACVQFEETFRRVRGPIIMSDEKKALVVSGDALPTVFQNELRLVDAQTLLVGLRQLQHRIPDFTQLSPEEIRSLMRVAYLDPVFRENALQVAAVWDHTKTMTGRSGDELREEAEVIRIWDEVERDWTVVLKGISAANLKRKHHLGKALWRIYNVLRVTVKHSDRLMKPYFDAMKEAYLKSRKRPAKDAKTEPKTPKE
jgi:hypothetical protein